MSEQRWRHEMKYLINKPEWALLRARFPAAVRRDPHVGENGEYMIRSLYFDDYWNTAYQEKDAGVLTRHKYRIRVYNCSDSRILLERKNKYGPYIWKQSAPVTRGQVEAVLAGDYAALLQGDAPLLREFYYECTARLMRPRVIVDYDREPFVLDAGDVRITFDKHVRAGMGGFDLFDPDLPTVETLRGDQMIMEVKFTEFLPKQVRGILPPRSAELTAASKYVLCCDAAARQMPTNRTEGIQWKR